MRTTLACLTICLAIYWIASSFIFAPQRGMTSDGAVPAIALQSSGGGMPAEESRLVAFQRTPADAAYATLHVSTDPGNAGNGCHLALSINGIPAARLAPAEIAEFYVPSGTVTVKAGQDPQSRSFCGMGSSARQLKLEAGGSAHLLLSTDASGAPELLQSN